MLWGALPIHLNSYWLFTILRQTWNIAAKSFFAGELQLFYSKPMHRSFLHLPFVCCFALVSRTWLYLHSRRFLANFKPVWIQVAHKFFWGYFKRLACSCTDLFSVGYCINWSSGLSSNDSILDKFCEFLWAFVLHFSLCSSYQTFDLLIPVVYRVFVFDRCVEFCIAESLFQKISDLASRGLKLEESMWLCTKKGATLRSTIESILETWKIFLGCYLFLAFKT